MIPSIQSLLALSFGLATLVHAQYDPKLVGTWTTKSKKVITGPVRLLNPLSHRVPFTLTMRFPPGVL